MLDWEWMGDPYVAVFFVRLLLSVNSKEKKWQGRIIRRGQILTSFRKLAEETNWHPSTIRRVIQCLCETGEIKVESDKNGTLITVVNFGKYQPQSVSSNDTPTVKSVLSSDTSSDTPSDTPNDTPSDTPSDTHNKNSKNIILQEDNIKNKKLRAGENLGIFENVKLSDSDIERIRMNFATEGLDDNFILRCIDKLSSFLHEGNGSHYKSHAAAITLWVKTSVLEDDRRTGKAQQRYQQQTQPSSMQLTENEKRQIWARLSDKDKQEYLDTHDGLTPWQYDEQHGTN